MRLSPIRAAFAALVLSLAASSHAGAQAAEAEPATVEASQAGAAQAISKSAMAAPADLTVRLSGRLLLPDGKPAAGASLHIAWLNAQFQTEFRKIEVAADGRYQCQKTLKQLPPNVNGIVLIASAAGDSGGGFLLQSVPRSGVGNQALTLKLEPAATITGRLSGPDGAPLAGVKVAVKSLKPSSAGRFTGDGNGQSPFSFMNTFPVKLAKANQVAVTDPHGAFALSGLPRGMSAQIAPPDGLLFAAGSRSPVDVVRPVNQAGLLIAMKPGSLQVKVTDPATGKPVNGAQVQVVPTGALQLLAVQSGGSPEELTRAGQGPSTTDARGQLTLEKLTPGEFFVDVSGVERLVTVRPGAQEVVAISVRTGTLTGKLLGPDGKPRAGVPLVLEFPANSSLRSQTSMEAFMSGNARGAAQSGADGKFEIATFPWGVKEVTVRAEAANNAAEWKGDPSTIKGDLVLRMQPGALATVVGRLLDTHDKPIPAGRASVIRWRDDQPRISWLFNAKEAKVDAGGRFAVDGLRRGESFSVISGSPFSGGMQEERGFESPRFEVSLASGSSAQDLGDVVVHPLSGGDQILQVYGFESREQIARLTSLVAPPPSKEVEAARKALMSYAKAIEEGDLEHVHRATSRITPGWSPDLSAFVRTVSLRASRAEEIAAARPARFIPRIALAYVLTFNKAQSLFNLNFGASARELDANPDWVLFTSSDEATPRSLGLMRHEDGEWRFVSLSGLPAGLDDLILSGLATKPTAPADMRKPAPRMSEAERVTVASVAKEYLAAWEREDATRMQQLTSPFSPTWGKTADGMRLAMERRADEGRCPSQKPTSGVRIVEDLSTWETAWLAGYAGTIQQFSGTRQASPRVPAALQAGYPGAYAARGDIAVARYEASEGPFLMLLVRVAGDWRVLEAAIPL